jgi:hypothetical protein
MFGTASAPGSAGARDSGVAPTAVAPGARHRLHPQGKPEDTVDWHIHRLVVADAEDPRGEQLPPVVAVQLELRLHAVRRVIAQADDRLKPSCPACDRQRVAGVARPLQDGVGVRGAVDRRCTRGECDAAVPGDVV